jgi:general secretion pathway protein F
MRTSLAFAYHGTRSARRVQGVVFAGSRLQARARLRRMHVQGARLRLAPLASLRALAAPGFDPLDLEQFYTFAGRSIDKGLPRAALLSDAADFAQDERLRHALTQVRDAVREGAPLGRALQQAGFAERDAALVAAGEESGRLAAVLLALAGEVRRETALRQGLQRALMSPLVVAVAAYVMAWLALVFLAPTMAERFAAQAHAVRLPEVVARYYAFVGLFNRHLPLASALYLGGGVATVLFFRTTAWTALRDAAFPTLRRLAERTELARLWGAHALMTDSGMGPYAVARALARAASVPRLCTCFQRLERQLRLGVDLDQAVERAGFPRDVVAGVRAAVASRAVADGTRELSERLTVQATLLTARVQVVAGALAAVTGAAVVLGFAALTVLPQMAAVLSSF